MHRCSWSQSQSASRGFFRYNRRLCKLSPWRRQRGSQQCNQTSADCHSRPRHGADRGRGWGGILGEVSVLTQLGNQPISVFIFVAIRLLWSLIQLISRLIARIPRRGFDLIRPFWTFPIETLLLSSFFRDFSAIRNERFKFLAWHALSRKKKMHWILFMKVFKKQIQPHKFEC